MEEAFGLMVLFALLVALAYASSQNASDQQLLTDTVRNNFRMHCEKVVGGYAVQDLSGKYRCVMDAE